jgi:hypothetical protein
LIHDIKGALTIPVLVKYLHLGERVQGQTLSSEEDQMLWRWSSTGQYSEAMAYQSMFNRKSTVIGAKEIWKIKAPNKCKFFLWLLILDRCWTANHR